MTFIGICDEAWTGSEIPALVRLRKGAEWVPASTCARDATFKQAFKQDADFPGQNKTCVRSARFDDSTYRHRALLAEPNL